MVCVCCVCSGTRVCVAAVNAIGPAGATAIAEALKTNKTVTTVFLSSAWSAMDAPASGPCGVALVYLHAAAGNRIGQAGAAAIMEALQINQTVSKLDLASARAAAARWARERFCGLVWCSWC